MAFIGCAKTYTAPDFDTYYQTHKTVAILPFKISYDNESKLGKNATPEMIAKIKEEESFAFQQHLHVQFLKRQAKKNEYTVDFQDVSQTNILLNQAGFKLDSLYLKTKKEITDVLNVDAIISGTIRKEKPMSTATAVALGIIFDIWGPTNQTFINMNIYDGESGKLIWNYDHEASGSVGSSPDKLAQSLISGVSKSFPYKKDRKPAKTM
jgi:hypothetical protein